MSIIYTDGSCLSNPDGPSGWAFHLQEDGEIWIVSGGESCSTNNRMEMKAVIEALKFSNKRYCEINTDSKLVINCSQNIWKRNKNLDLWREYDEVSMNKEIKWKWVKCHSGNEYNEIVDRLCREEAKNMKKNK